MDETLISHISDVQRSGAKAALVTIIRTRGFTPRSVGTKMLVLPDRRTFGTIGGGSAEGEVRRKALEVMEKGQSGVYSITILDEAATAAGIDCDSMMEVFIQYL